MRSKWVVLGPIVLVSIVDRVDQRYLTDLLTRDSTYGLPSASIVFILHGVLPWLARILSLLVGGRLAEMYGSRRILAGAIILSAAGLGLCELATTPTAFLIDRVVFYGAEGLGVAAMYKLVGDMFKPIERSLAFGVWFAIPSVLGFHNWRALSWFTTTIGLDESKGFILGLSVVTAALVNHFVPGSLERSLIEANTQPTPRASAVSLADGLQYRHVWLLAGVYLMLDAAFNRYLANYMFHMYQRFRGSALVISFKDLEYLQAGTEVLGIVVLVWISWKLTAIQRPILVAACACVAASATLLATIVHNFSLATIGFLLGNLLLRGAYVPFWVVVLENAPSRKYGLVCGVVLAGGTIGYILMVSFLAPWLYEAKSPTIVLLVSTGAMVVAAVLMVLVQNQLGNPKGDLVPVEPAEA